MLVRSCIILAVIMAAAAASKRVQLKGGRQQAPDSEDSPSVRKLVYNLLDEDRNATGLDTLPITLTLPPQGLLAGRAQSKALILFYNGFKAKASFYRLYARGLALRGYTVMQYDLPWYKNVEIQHEVALAPRMVKWLHTLSEKQHGSEGALDFALVGAAGHSRGATLATLIYAEHPELVQAVFLVDPVDMPPRGSDGVSSPSAVAAIKAKGLAVGMSGAGVVGRCNPAGINYQKFFEAAAGSSWRLEVPEAGHGQFMKGPWLIDRAADLLCGRGKDSHAETIDLTLRPMLAWFERHLQPEKQPAEGAAHQSFLEWVRAEEALGKITFTIKQ